MNRIIHSRLKALLAAATVAVGVAMSAQADIVSNCFRVVSYGVNWHVECTLDGFTNALDIAIDDNANNGFRAGDHGSQAYAYFADVESSEVVDAGTFIAMNGMVEFVDQRDFIVAFVVGCSEATHINGNFGWVHLAYEGGTIVLKGGAINTTRGAALVAEGGAAPSIVNLETGCETNTFYATLESTPHILHRRDSAFDFVIFNYTEHCWGIAANHSSGHGYVSLVSAGTYVDESTFSQHRTSDGYDFGDLFFLAFNWEPDANDTTRHTRYGWLAIGLKDGVPAILASEMSETAGSPFVGRGFGGVEDGPEAPVDGVIWQCNFDNGVQWMNISNMSEVASHFLLTGTYSEAYIDDGSYSGRFCAEIGCSSGNRGWFSVNERIGEGLGARYVPDKWESLFTSFKTYAGRGWEDGENIVLYATELPASDVSDNNRSVQFYIIPGSIVNIDDKIALWYCDYEGEYSERYWRINAGVTNATGEIESRNVRLAAKGTEAPLASQNRNWVTVGIEAVNDGSPHGLAYRIYIGGVLACSEEDGGTVFRARPEASDKDGITALGLGGDTFIDDIVFSSATIEPLVGVDINPNRFGPANVELMAGELDALAGIIGLESLGGLERVTMYPWEDDSGAEPQEAVKNCIDLGISPFEVKPDSDDGKGLMLFFKNPAAVRATDIDPVARTVTGQIVPADGTRIVQPPQRFMFGINHIMDFGTPYSHAEDYGYDMYWHEDGEFHLDTTSYAASNGVFTITYAPKFSDDASAFFSLSIKDYRYSY